jgi:hypothetical protein
MLHRPASPTRLQRCRALDGPGDATLPRITLASLRDPFGPLDRCAAGNQGARLSKGWPGLSSAGHSPKAA